MVLAVVMAGLCPEHALSNPVKAKPAMILAVDFIMCAGNEVETDIIYVIPPQVHKFCAFAASSVVIPAGFFIVLRFVIRSRPG